MREIIPLTPTGPAPIPAPMPASNLPGPETVWLYPKLDDFQITANFALREFHCRCRKKSCHFTLVHPKLVESLQTLRDRLTRPLFLTSGFRCRIYNRIVGGSLRSYHTRGMAADVLCAGGEDWEELAGAAADVPAIGGIGRYPGRGVIHLDVRPRERGELPIAWSA